MATSLTLASRRCQAQLHDQVVIDTGRAKTRARVNNHVRHVSSGTAAPAGERIPRSRHRQRGDLGFPDGGPRARLLHARNVRVRGVRYDRVPVRDAGPVRDLIHQLQHVVRVAQGGHLYARWWWQWCGRSVRM